MNEKNFKPIVVDASTQTYLKSNGLNLIFKFLRHNSNLFKYFRKQTKFSNQQNINYNLFTLNSVHDELFEFSLINNDLKKLLNYNEKQMLDNFFEKNIEKSSTSLNLNEKISEKSFDTKSNQIDSEHKKNYSICSNSDDLITELKQVLEMRNKKKLIQQGSYDYNDL
jgi:hypothetical protein